MECGPDVAGSVLVRARWILGPLLIAMAVGQLLSVDGFIDIIRSYRAVPSPAAPTLALTLVAAELVAGVGLVRREPTKSVVWIGVAVAIVWTLLGTQAFARGLALQSCGCFGTFFAQPLRGWVLFEDAELIALALLAMSAILSPTSFRRAPVAATFDRAGMT